MLIEIGLVLAAYTSGRLFNFYQKEKIIGEPLQKEIPQKLQEPLPSETQEEVIDDQLQEISFYLKMSGVSMGVAILRDFYPSLALLNLSVFTYTAFPYFRQIEKSLLEEHQIDGYVLYGVADLLTLGLGRHFTAALAVSLYHLSKFMIAQAQDRSKKTLLDVFSQHPSKVWLLKDQIEVEVPLEQLNPSDIIVVNTGEMIPVDGTIVEGLAAVDQHMLTGESQPAEKSPGEGVFASTTVVSGRIVVRVEKSGQETTVAKIAQILNRSISFKTQTQLKGEQWADTGNVPILLLAFASWPTLGPVGTAVILNGHIAQTIRVIAPLGTLNHLNIASHKGILVKQGSVLEELGQIDTVLFDKTGTLTHEQPEIERIIACDAYRPEEILRNAATAEYKLAHPIARAIVQKAQEAGLTFPVIEDSQYKMGYGLTVHFENKIIRVGSHRFMVMEGLEIPENIAQAQTHAHHEGHSLVMVAINAQVSGAIELRTTVRPEVKRILHGLRQHGIKQIAVVSGDHQQPTQKLAEALGIDTYFYEVLPEKKADIVEQLQKDGRTVCFVGDGINDAIAMRKANVSVSMKGATSIATDVAQIVLMDGTLSKLCDLIDISHSLETNLQRSLAINLSQGVITIGGTFLFHIDILVALFINIATFTAGVGNALLPLKELIDEEEMKLKPDFNSRREQLRLELSH